MFPFTARLCLNVGDPIPVFSGEDLYGSKCHKPFWSCLWSQGMEDSQKKMVAKKYCSMHGVLLLTMIRYDMTICLDNGKSTLYV